MTTTHLPTVIRRRLRTLAATGAAVVLVLLSVGSPAGAQTTDDGAGPTEAFCEAWADFQSAQDGAELNTALGAMQAALTPDAPAEVAEAIVTLGQGDLAPGETQAALDTVAAWADEACAGDSTTTVDTDDGDAPTGGVDTGAGGTATGSGSNGLVIGVTVALVAGSVGAAAAANRRRLAHRS